MRMETSDVVVILLFTTAYLAAAHWYYCGNLAQQFPLIGYTVIQALPAGILLVLGLDVYVEACGCCGLSVQALF